MIHMLFGILRLSHLFINRFMFSDLFWLTKVDVGSMDNGISHCRSSALVVGTVGWICCFGLEHVDFVLENMWVHQVEEIIKTCLCIAGRKEG